MATANLYWPYPPSQVGTWIWGYPGHQGTDWPKPTGTPVPATSDGTIVFAGDDGLGGLTIDLQRGDGLIQRFGHLSQIWVKVGQRVAAGNTIGLVGSTGNSTGPHLHWELRWDRLWNGGRVVDPRTMNPATFGSDPGPAPSNPNRKDRDMFLVMDTGGTGYIVTPDGVHGLASPQIYNLFYRIINSDQLKTPFSSQVKAFVGGAKGGTPDTFLKAEMDIVNANLKIVAKSVQTGVQIDVNKTADALTKALGEKFNPEVDIDVEDLAKAFDIATPKIVAALIKQSGEKLAKA